MGQTETSGSRAHLAKRATWRSEKGCRCTTTLRLGQRPVKRSNARSHDSDMARYRSLRMGLVVSTLAGLSGEAVGRWQQEAMAENAVAVSKLGQELFERIVSLHDRFSNLGKKLDGAVDAYNAAIGSLESRVHVSARRMAGLGIADAHALGEPARIETKTRSLQPIDERSGATDDARTAPAAKGLA